MLIPLIVYIFLLFAKLVFYCINVMYVRIVIVIYLLYKCIDAIRKQKPQYIRCFNCNPIHPYSCKLSRVWGDTCTPGGDLYILNNSGLDSLMAERFCTDRIFIHLLREGLKLIQLFSESWVVFHVHAQAQSLQVQPDGEINHFKNGVCRHKL